MANRWRSPGGKETLENNKTMNRFNIRLFIIISILLAGCGTDPSASDFTAPKLGTVTIEAEAFRVRMSCPVNGSVAGVTTYGFRFGEAGAGIAGNPGALWVLPATLEDGWLKAEVKALRSDTDYHVEAFVGNGTETLTTQTVAFRTEAGPEIVDIPDPVFRRYLLANFDENGDEVLTVPEALSIHEIMVCTDSITSLKGIEKMSHLIRLEALGSDGYRGKLTQIDLSGNPLLECLNVNDNFISNLDLSAVTYLKEVCFATNPLSSIDFSANPLIIRIYMNNIPLETLPDMMSLPLESLHFDHVARLIPEDYFRNFPGLHDLNMSFYEGRRINLSCNTRLDALWAYCCPNLEEIDLTATALLKRLYVGECPKLRRVLVRAGTEFEELEKDGHTEIIYVE